VKTVLLLVAGVLIGIAVSVGGAFLAAQYYLDEESMATYEPDWMPDFDDRIYDSASKLAAAKSAYERWIALGDVALWSVDAGFVENAKTLAEELLSTSDGFKSDWNYGNAIHKANLTLGRLALREGDTTKAIEFLKLAGETPGSPQLNSFGPNMTLALELLKIDERDAVIEYFDLCANFWSLGHKKLDAWKAIVEAGDIPRFGANLVY